MRAPLFPFLPSAAREARRRLLAVEMVAVPAPGSDSLIVTRMAVSFEIEVVEALSSCSFDVEVR
jgi:hypothetical protein